MNHPARKSPEIITTGIIDKVISRKGGGVIFIWDYQDNNIPQAVKVPYNVLPCVPERGETWSVKGNIINTNWGEQILAINCTRELPTGENFPVYLARNPRYVGLQKRRANKIWMTFGDTIFELLNDRDIDLITNKTKIPRLIICNLCDSWKQYNQEIIVVNWLFSYQLPTKLSYKIVECYGDEAIELLTQDPYRLLAFENWITVDKAAKLLGISDNDSNRRVAAVESILYERWDIEGHTAIEYDNLVRKIKSKLKLIDNNTIESIIKEAVLKNRIIKLQEHKYQHLGAHTLEMYIEHLIKNLLQNRPPYNKFDINLLHDFEKHKSSLLNYKLKLNAEQVSAVKIIMDNPISCITGGHGVGIEIVLEAVYSQINDPEKIIQCTLTYQEKHHLSETTGHTVITIAELIYKSGKNIIRKGSIIIIHESSMLDILLFTSLFRALPSNINLYLIGDAYLLPPIGPGLIFHLCAKSKIIPVAELTQTHHSDSAIEISQASRNIRNQIIPLLDDFNGLISKDYGLSFIDVKDNESLLNNILRCYRELSENNEVKILVYRKKTCEIINITLHNEYIEWKKSQGINVPLIRGLFFPIAEGEPIIWINKDDYKRDLYNGLTGYITEIFSSPIINVSENGEEIEFIAKAIFNNSDEILLSLEDFCNVRHAYAVTCQNSLVSKWEKLIVAIEDTKKIDNRWIYTAITRAQNQVICIGNRNNFNHLACSKPNIISRCVGIEL